MKEKLIIKNFGPIKSVDLDLGKMTILIGEQATGKSTIAKVLAVCRYLYFIPIPNNFNLFNESLKNWEIDSYLKEDTYIYYKNDDFIKELSNKKVNFTPISDFFKNDIESIKELYFKNKSFDPNKEADEKDLEVLNKLTQTLNNSLDTTFFIPTVRGLQSIFSLGKHTISSMNDVLFEQLSKLSSISKNVKTEINIKPLNIKYKNEKGDGYVKKENGEYHSLSNSASGYQSLIPIILSVNSFNAKEQNFIIEEPELNLFPKAQKKLMEFFVENINSNGHSFLLPTHSPYMVSPINNLMVAYRIGQKHKEKVNEIVEEKYWINPKDVSAYKLVYNENEQGVVANKEQGNLILEDLQEISIDYLDGISAEINSVWDKLLQVEDEN